MKAATLLLLAAAGASARSTLPLIAQLQHEAANAQPMHRQAYQGSRHRRSLSTSFLTEANTDPIRYKVDYRSLYEEHAPKYSACFRAGDWFRWGLPSQQTPPADASQATCTRGPGDSQQANDGCWGICLESDVITPAGREMVMSVVNEIVGREMGKFLSVRPVSGNLTFEVARSRYERALNVKGYSTSAACAADCLYLSDVAVDPAYCTTGTEADVVVSITKPPGLNGVAGTGSSCASDQAGRPIWIVFAWHTSIAALGDPADASAVQQQVEAQRALVMHEVLHGLGFSNSAFNYARSSSGARKNLIELKRVVDQDGAVDEVWHFVKGRAYDLAAEYFGCDVGVNGSAWGGLPLMGLPDAGRASHWETRIMRDDVMSYGFQSAVSGITLAAMEDLGFYLANYSAAQCISWGHKQGCAFVTSRCGIMTHDRSASVTSSSQCSGDPHWAITPDTYLASKCDRGNDPCFGSSENGYVAVTGSTGAGTCDSQCFYAPGQSRAGCNARPAAAVEEGVLGTTYEDLKRAALEWRVWLIPIMWGLCVLFVIGCVRRVVCPDSMRARTIALVIGWLVELIALVICGGAIYVYTKYDAYSAFVGRPTVTITACGSGGFALYGSLILYGVYKRNKCICLSAFWTLLLLTVGVILGTLFLGYWVWTTDDIPVDSINAIQGTHISKHVQSVDDWLSRELAVPLSVVEGVVCSTYTLCCRDPALDLLATSPTAGAAGASHNNATCIVRHAGLSNDLEVALQDPSSPNFCSYVTGAPRHLLVSPPRGVCNVLDSMLDGFSTSQCQSAFCASGVDAYITFVNQMVAFIQRYAVPLAAAMGVLVLFLVIWACNVRYVGKRLSGEVKTATKMTTQTQAPVISKV